MSIRVSSVRAGSLGFDSRVGPWNRKNLWLVLQGPFRGGDGRRVGEGRTGEEGEEEKKGERRRRGRGGEGGRGEEGEEGEEGEYKDNEDKGEEEEEEVSKTNSHGYLRLFLITECEP